MIREHRFYEKTFLVETRPAGERELTDRQRVRFSLTLLYRCWCELPKSLLALLHAHVNQC